jgi:FkbM family methyltransferase
MPPKQYFSVEGHSGKYYLNIPTLGLIEVRPDTADMKTAGEVLVVGVYDPVIRLLIDYGVEVRSVIDLGANIGLSARKFNQAFPLATINCIEPDRENIRLLRCNLEQQLLSGKAKIFEGAFWHQDGSIGYRQAYFATNVNEGTTVEVGHDYLVRCLSMQSLVDHFTLEAIDLIKIDIEGSEKNLFLNNLDWLERTHCIAIEFHGNSRSESRFDEIMLSFRFKVIDGEGAHTTIAIKARGSSERY